MSLGSAFRSFWHTMTSDDRHAGIDSPYRTGRHVPLNRQETLTSIATAGESRADINSPYGDESRRLNHGIDGTSYTGAGLPPVASPLSARSPGLGGPYSPGMRSMSAHRSRDDGFETVTSPGEIPMQSFSNGAPPPPPIGHSWRRIDSWAEENYPELFDQICEGATNNDLNELEHQLDCTLPQDVRDSLAIHDGQERGGIPTGIIFGSMLMDCEEIVQEWDQWRRVNQQYLLENTVAKPAMPSKTFSGAGSGSGSAAGPSGSQPSTSRSAASSPSSQKGSWRQTLMDRQDSVPMGAVQRAYAHSAWIPLVRDWGGNNLAVDLAPGPTGTWGQVIMFGRDYDTKYVVAPSWASFLAVVADDLNSAKWYIDDDSNELKLREFKTTRVEPSYFDILRWRTDQKNGRTAKATAKRRSMAPGAMSPTSSPYASPADAQGEARGRSLQRLSNLTPLASPVRPGVSTGKPSPLARVTEEAAAAENAAAATKNDKLVEVETPRVSSDVPSVPTLQSPQPRARSSLKAEAIAETKPDKTADDSMKTIEI
ncbi:SMI1/KNR4 family protein [Microdochium nivale]|nr:SMI1/KNR4 family protein [Microdochium nivale]